jgi:hypothetical protein
VQQALFKGKEGNVSKQSQGSKIIKLLKKYKRGVPNYRLSQCALKYTSVISDLRKDGHDIRAERVYNHGKATGTWLYRLVDEDEKYSGYRLAMFDEAIEELDNLNIRKGDK